MQTNELGQPIGDAVPGWAPRAWPEGVVLSGRYVHLRPLRASHADGILEALAGCPDRWTYRSDEPPADLEQARRLVETAYAGRSVPFAVMVAGAFQGMLSLLRTDVGNGTTEIGSILFSPVVARTAASTEATHLIAAYVFDELGYRRLEWKCDSLNEPSRKAAIRLGFVEEGTFRRAVVVKGRSRDTTWFAITDADWPRVREAHRRWLDPANFDARTMQHQKMSEVFVTLEA